MPHDLTKWTTFTKRTGGNKLPWLEERLTRAGIPHRRNGHSFHAPIMEVPESRLAEAETILFPIDDLPDFGPEWEGDSCSCSAPEDGLCAICLVDEAIAAIAKAEGK